MDSFTKLNSETRAIWDCNAEWWDDRIGDGNNFQLELIEPASRRLTGDLAGKSILDIACGAGRFARQMAEMGAKVTAIDFSQKFLQRARQRTPEGLNIDYRLVDVMDRQGLAGLGQGVFDGAIATMALMDISDISPLLSALPGLLKSGGWFVFSLLHPCFDGYGRSHFAESDDDGGSYTVRTGVRVSHYLTPKASLGLGIIGQPKPQYYFHRPLSVLLGECFRNGFVMDGIEEPRLAQGQAGGSGLAWDQMTEIPPILVVRMRLMPQKGL